jgi:catechol 2,3-dioxygenase-like lactoylglutathione lyase family enzyme
MNMKLEVLIIPVSDVDRAKAFYQKLGWRLDIDVANGAFRAVHFTPPGSGASILFGTGVTSSEPGAAENLVLAVDDVDAARRELIDRGAEVSEVFHYAGGPFNNAVANPRVAGRDPQGRSYHSFASFKDPDGNGWLLQEITERLPGRIAAPPTDTETTSILRSLLERTADAHGVYEKELGKHDADWPRWYAEHMTKTLSRDGYRLGQVQ